MSRVVDARGLPCPQPVILTRTAMQQAVQTGSIVTTIVDNPTSRENVARMAQRAGATVDVESRADGIYLHMSGGQVPQQEADACDGAPADGRRVVVVPGELMGRGEHEELGQVLMRGFFHTLGEVDPLPGTIIFLNSGVKLVVDGSSVLEDLRALRDKGVLILACGTCLGYYGLKDRVAIGQISNMYTIAETMLGAAVLVTL